MKILKLKIAGQAIYPATITNAVKDPTFTKYNPDAELSLYDSLYTYSYDRVAAGLSTKCTIKLNAVAKAIYNSNSELFNDTVRAAILTKGYLIS